MSFVAPSSSHAQASLPTSFAAALRNAAAASKPTPLRTGAQAAPVPVPAAEGQSPRPNSSASASAFDKPAAQAQPHERRCEDCGKKNPKYHERGDATCRQRWCGPCQRRNHPTAIKARTPRECESPLRHFTSSPPGRWRADVARRSPAAQGPKQRVSVGRHAQSALLRVLDSHAVSGEERPPLRAASQVPELRLRRPTQIVRCLPVLSCWVVAAGGAYGDEARQAASLRRRRRALGCGGRQETTAARLNV